MGGISASGHGYYAHGNTAGLDGWWWCVWGFVVAHCWVVDQHAGVGWFPAAPRSWDGCSGGCGAGGLLFVNYIVDASIFDAAHPVGVCGVFFDDLFVLCGV